jgi:DNA-binding winged helix-turn-helix (wHTH) protein
MNSLPRRIHFGVFEADLAIGELRKQGRRIRVQQQPFLVLAMLLERAGDVVSREELQKAVWPADTFIDFDYGLNTAIKKLRLALGDSADTPRFVETLPRKGYRFIAPVNWELPCQKESAADSPSSITAHPLPTPTTGDNAVHAPARRLRVWSLAGLLAAVALALLGPVKK